MWTEHVELTSRQRTRPCCLYLSLEVVILDVNTAQNMGMLLSIFMLLSDNIIAGTSGFYSCGAASW